MKKVLIILLVVYIVQVWFDYSLYPKNDPDALKKALMKPFSFLFPKPSIALPS